MSDPSNVGGVPDPEPTPSVVPEAVPVAATSPAVTPQPVTATGSPVGKTRHPWGVWGLSVITLGIYFLYWYYKVNSELKEYDRSIEVEPGLAVLAQFVPIVSLVSIWNTGGRIAQAEHKAASSDGTSPLIGLLLMFVAGAGVIYYQSQLNKLWAIHGSPEAGTLV